jgi:hypothetical protein
MPITVTSRPGGVNHPNPFRSPINATMQLRVDVSGLTANEVDVDGYLKPGVPLARDGTLVGAAEAVRGCNVEAVKIAADNAPATLAAANDVDVAVATFVVVSQDILEDILGRVLTAAEIAGFDLAGSHCVLV